MQSLFTPYLGKIPKAFVNRDKEIEEFTKILADASSGKSLSILLTGQRTYIALDESAAELSELVKRTYGKVCASLEEEFIDLRSKRFLKRISPKLTLKLREFGIQLSAALNEEEVNKNNFALALGKLIKNKNLAIFLDETQSVLKTKGLARFLVNSLYAELPDYASN